MRVSNVAEFLLSVKFRKKALKIFEKERQTWILSFIDNFSWRLSPPITAQSSFGGFEVEPMGLSEYRTPHRQRLLLFRYSRMNERNKNRYETLIRQPLVAAENTPNTFSRCSSLDSPPVAPPRRFHIRKGSQYQSMVEDNSIDDSDGSNMTSITTTTTGE